MLGLLVLAALSSLLFLLHLLFSIASRRAACLNTSHFSPPFTTDLLSTCMFLSGICAHTHIDTHSLPLPLSISPTQSLLSHGPRRPVQYLLHSACGLARKAHEPGRMHHPCQTPHPHNSSLWTHNSKPHKHS